MSWIDAAETAMQNISAALGVTYDFERNESPAEQLPDTYMVYFLADDEGVTWADGRETSHEARVQVSLFYRDKRVMLTIPKQIENYFVDVGFTLGPVGHIPYQPDTGHYGWRRDFYYYERRDLNA